MEMARKMNQLVQCNEDPFDQKNYNQGTVVKARISKEIYQVDV